MHNAVGPSAQSMCRINAVELSPVNNICLFCRTGETGCKVSPRSQGNERKHCVLPGVPRFVSGSFLGAISGHFWPLSNVAILTHIWIRTRSQVVASY